MPASPCESLLECRSGERLETGEPAVRHAPSTADLPVGLRMDQTTVSAALLNGCLGRAGATQDKLAARFGAGVAQMVADLARIDKIANVSAIIAAKDQDEHEENLRRLLLGIAEDMRVVLVVLAERLHLMRGIRNLEAERQRKIALDTQRVYAPLANRLGVWQVKWELEDLALRYLEPEEYSRIAKLLDGRRAERQAYIAGIIALLRAKFDEAGIKAEISGRPKHIFSIWRKMQRKGVDIDEIFDLRAVRIMVEDVSACYAALGIVHGTWRHIPKEFDDYIATPKGNLYRSLHTAVIGPEGKALEVQIRTHEVHRHAELGVAAHWSLRSIQTTRGGIRQYLPSLQGRSHRAGPSSQASAKRSAPRPSDHRPPRPTWSGFDRVPMDNTPTPPLEPQHEPPRIRHLHPGRTPRPQARRGGANPGARPASAPRLAPHSVGRRAAASPGAHPAPALPLAGFQYHQGPGLWPRLSPGQPLTLVREPANPYDPRAVRIDWQGHKLGYIPRLDNAAASQLIDRGERLVARIAALAESSDPWPRR